MISPLHQFSLPVLIVGAVFIVVLLAVVQHWALRRLNADPADDLDNASGDKASEILGDTPVRSKVGTPRPRRLKPLSVDAEEPAFASPRSGSQSAVPADSLAMAGASASGKSKEVARTAPAIAVGSKDAPQPALASAGSAGTPPPRQDKAAEPGVKSPILPPLVAALGDLVGGKSEKPGPAAAPTDKPREAVPVPPLSVGTPVTASAVEAGKNPTTPPPPVLPPLSVAAAPGGSQPASAEPDDVKKRKILPPVPAAEQKGSASVVSPKTGETAAVPAAPTTPPTPATPSKAVDITPAPKPEPAPKAGERPRIFLPANLPATAKAAEIPPVPVAVPAPSAPVEAKTGAPELPEKPTDKEVKPAEPVPATTPAPKSETTPEPKLEAKPEAAPVPVPPTPAEPVAAKAEEPVLVPESLVKPDLTEKAPETVKPEAEVPATPVPAAVTTPTENVPPPIPILPREAVPKEVSVSTSQPTMAQNETTTDLPANSRASAQLTLGFEVTSLQLTPFFKLGAVQLKSLSNVASLHLIATQSADNPLAAGISFQIENVELNESSHIRSILLKPLQGAEPSAVPQSKQQVNSVQIAPGEEGAPISVSSSGQTVQLLATFTIAAMDFTPAFEIGSLRLEPTSNSVLLRLAASSRPASLDLPPSFEVANVQLGDGAQIAGLRLTPGGKAA